MARSRNQKLSLTIAGPAPASRAVLVLLVLASLLAAQPAQAGVSCFRRVLNFLTGRSHDQAMGQAEGQTAAHITGEGAVATEGTVAAATVAAVEQVDPAVERGNKYRAKFDADFQRIVFANVRDGEKKYHIYSRCAADGNKHLRVMKELGFDQTPGAPVPTLSEIVAAADKRADDWIANSNGAYTKDDVIYAGKVYRINGKAVGIRYGAPIPDGAKVVDGFLSGQEFLDMFDQGITIISGLDNHGNDGGGVFNMTQHDLVHLSGEIDGANGFEWSAAIRRGARKLREQGVKINDNEQGGIKGRLTDITEGLEVVYPEKLAQFKDQLELPTKEAGHVYSVAEIEAYLRMRATSPAALKELVARIEKLYPQVANTMGGTAGDPYYRYIGRAGSASQLAQLLTSAKNAAVNGSHTAAREVARLEAALMDFAQITPAEWTEQGLVKSVDKDSKLYKLLCLQGIWEQGSYFHEVYCKGGL